MQAIEPTVLLIGHNTPLCGAVRDALERCETACHVAAVTTFAAARRSVADFSPDLIVLEESSLPQSPEAGARPSRIEDVVTALAGFAPVVVLGERQAPASLSALIAAGAADFVEEARSDLPAAAACVRKRLETVRRLNSDAPELAGRAAASYLPSSFGEILRHELNNPLTGILGNAELLLAEARRQRNLQMPESSVKRLETIAALAVRMRETVRRLSQACESRAEQIPTL